MTDNRQMADPPDILIGMLILAALCCIGAAFHIFVREGIILWVVLFLLTSWVIGWMFRKWADHD